jgi:hypothetical protein
MEHTLDVNKLELVFDGLCENAHKLNAWENDRLEEWYIIWKHGGTLSEKQLGCLEKMWVKI